MEKTTQEFLLVHQQEAEDEVRKLTEELSRMGKILTHLGTEVMKTPANVLFINAPVGLGEIPSELVGAPTFNWDELPDRVVLARRIKALRRAIARLAVIRRQLML
jgi:hypothetical protein